MKLTKLPLLIALPVFAAISLTGCGTVESAAKDDCTSIGWQVGTAGYNDCFKTRVRERNLDYSLPPGDQPSPSLI